MFSQLSMYFLSAVSQMRRSPLAMMLIALTIAVGISATVMTLAIYAAASANPLAYKSSMLFYPRIDPWGKSKNGALPDALTFTDANALSNAKKAKWQAAVFAVSLPLRSDVTDRPRSVSGYAVERDFFFINDLRLAQGNFWSEREETESKSVVIVSEALALSLFGDSSAVGKQIFLNDKPFLITGVLRHWNPRPRYFDLPGSGAFSQSPIDVLIPLGVAIESGFPSAGSVVCAPRVKNAADACVWLSYMTEFASVDDVRGYRAFLATYAEEQRRQGRFAWPANVRLDGYDDWMELHKVVSADVKTSVLVAIGFLLVCVVNASSMLLGLYLARSRELMIRRALGASRQQLLAHSLMEALLIGAGGAILGTLLTIGAFQIASAYMQAKIDVSVVPNSRLMLWAAGLAMTAALLSVMYPALRAAFSRSIVPRGAA